MGFWKKAADNLGNMKTGLQETNMRILKRGAAMRVIFFYPGEEGTYVDNAEVTLFENGIVHIASDQEESTTHLQNCEILWSFPTAQEEKASKVRLLQPKGEFRNPEKNGPDKTL